jgi:hypothetical protein
MQACESYKSAKIWIQHSKVRPILIFKKYQKKKKKKKPDGKTLGPLTLDVINKSEQVKMESVCQEEF